MRKSRTKTREESSNKKLKKVPSKNSKLTKKTKKSSNSKGECDSEYGVSIDRYDMNQRVTPFSLKHLVDFAQSSTLSDVVQLMMLVGSIRRYLAPKVGDERDIGYRSLTFVPFYIVILSISVSYAIII